MLEYWLEEVFDKDAELCEEWLLEVGSNPHASYSASRLAKRLARRIPPESRTRLILEFLAIPIDEVAHDTLAALVNGDPTLFEVVLARFDSNAALKSLEVAMDMMETDAPESHPELVQIARSHGHDPADIARAIFPSMWSTAGDAKAAWSKWIQQFDRLRDHSDPTVRRVHEFLIAEAASRARCSSERDRLADLGYR